MQSLRHRHFHISLGSVGINQRPLFSCLCPSVHALYPVPWLRFDETWHTLSYANPKTGKLYSITLKLSFCLMRSKILRVENNYTFNTS